MDSREIKFRGKRTYNGEWIHGWLVCEDNGTAWISQYYHKGEWVQVDPKTIGQYTDKKDSKRTEEYPEGQEVYKGDIARIKTTSNIKPISDFKSVIKYVENQVSFVFGEKLLRGHLGKIIEEHEAYILQLEVIGNIYDNPELLKEINKSI